MRNLIIIIALFLCYGINASTTIVPRNVVDPSKPIPRKLAGLPDYVIIPGSDDCSHDHTDIEPDTEDVDAMADELAANKKKLEKLKSEVATMNRELLRILDANPEIKKNIAADDQRIRDAERKRQAQWTAKLAESKRKRQAKGKQRFLAATTLKQVLEDGKFLLLQDGTKLEVPDSVRAQAAKWKAGDRIQVLEFKDKDWVKIKNIRTDASFYIQDKLRAWTTRVTNYAASMKE